MKSSLVSSLCSSNPLLFGREYLSIHVPDRFGEHHHVMSDAVRKDGTGKRFVWAAPRGHAKSTLMSLVVPMWWACYGFKRYIILVADTSHQAEMFLAAIISEFEENPGLNETFGLGPMVDQKGQPVAWRDREIVLSNGVTIAAYGAGKAIRGAKKGEHRPDAIVVDDLENDEHVRTAEQRDKLDQWFLRALLNLGDHDTDIYMVGTVLHHDSVLSRRLNDPSWDSHTWRAITERGEGDERTFHALWPERWSIEALQKKQSEIGSIAFAAEYQNDPTAMGAGVFQDGWFKYYQAAPEGLAKYAGVDLAISKSTAADKTAIVKVATDGTRVYVLEAVEDKWSFREAETEIIGRCHDCAVVGIETVAYQVAMAEELMRNSILPIREMHPSKDKLTRAISLSAHVESGKVLFDRYKHGELRRQLLDFPMGAHDDLVDALGYAVQLALEHCGYVEGVQSGSIYEREDPGY